MSDDLRARMRAVFKPKDSSVRLPPKSAESVLRGYNVDSINENGVTSTSTCNTTFPNENKDVTPLHRFCSNRECQTEKGLAEPSLAYRAASAEPAGTVCGVEIIELPATGRYRKTFAFLQLRPPTLVPVERWQQCVKDGKRFLAVWGQQAEALGWTSADLFGLSTPPAKPHPSYNRLSRYDATGLIWLLAGREVVALTAATASIRKPRTSTITVFRKNNRPALGPLGDSLADLK